jgi:hypothetical protein
MTTVQGAGGTQGGVGEFLVGVVMMCGGFYMLFSAIVVRSGFGMGMRLYPKNGSWEAWDYDFSPPRAPLVRHFPLSKRG